MTAAPGRGGAARRAAHVRAADCRPDPIGAGLSAPRTRATVSSVIPSRLVVVVVLALAVALAGCRQPPRPPGRGSADSDENQATLDKLQGYLDCLNDHSQAVFRIADRFRRRQAAPPAGGDPHPGVELPPDPGKCLKAIQDARKQRPPLPEIDAAAERFATALQRVFTLTTAANGAPAPGGVDPRTSAGALLGELGPAFHDFDTAQAALFDQVSRLNHEVHADQIARLEQRDGQTLAVRTELVMLRAEELVRFAATPWDHLDQLDLAALGTALDRVDGAIEDTASYVAAHPKEAEEFGRFWSFIDDARSYVIAGHQLARRARDRVAYSDAEQIMAGAGNDAAIVGSPGALARAYNAVVEDFAHR